MPKLYDWKSRYDHFYCKNSQPNCRFYRRGENGNREDCSLQNGGCVLRVNVLSVKCGGYILVFIRHGIIFFKIKLD